VRTWSPSELTTYFWTQVNSGILVRPVCLSCGTNFFSPQVLCPTCQSDSWEYQESSGHGCIYSFTVIHRPPDSSFPTPLIVADIELDEGWRMFSWIIECESDDVRIGQRVRVTFDDFDTGTLPVFKTI
jgi:uncharacterized OB-fold protein